MDRSVSSFSLSFQHATRFDGVGSNARDRLPGPPVPAAGRGEVDPILLHQALEGGSESVQRLVERLQPTIQAEVALVVLGRSSTGPKTVRLEVEDLVQDVWETLFRDNWRVLRHYQPDRGASLKTFVGLVSRRVAIDALRSGRRNPWREQPSPPQHLETNAPLPVSLEQRVQDRNLLEHVYGQLEIELGAKGRSALESLFAEGLSIEEASERTGMTKSALYTWRKRITQRARSLLAHFSGSREDP